MFIDLAKIMSDVIYRMLCTPMWDMTVRSVTSAGASLVDGLIRPERDREPETAPLTLLVAAA